MVQESRAEGPKSVKSAERVFDLLEAIGAKQAGVTFPGLQAELGIPKSSLHALLEVLTSRGYVELDETTRRYALGIRVWEIGQAFQRHLSVVAVARPVLEAIVAQANETAQLARLAGPENVYLARVDSSHALRLQSDVGTRLSAHATGVGKALLAQLGDTEVRARFGDGDLPVYSRSTHATVTALLAELAETRRRGFAIDNEEYTSGVFCLAVPIRDAGDEATTALSVSVPILRATIEGLGAILALIADGSLQIAAKCGARGADPKLAALVDPNVATAAIRDLVTSERYRLGFAT